MAIDVITAPTPRYGSNVRVFLGGSIDMGAARDWQSEVIQRAYDFENRDITFYNPRRNGVFSGEQSIHNDAFATQVNWEMDRIQKCDIFLMFITAESKAPISLGEFYFALGNFLDTDIPVADKTRIVVGVEPGFWRRGNIEVMCDRFSVPLLDNLDDVVYALESHIKDVNNNLFLK
jgi:hypothetical protein